MCVSELSKYPSQGIPVHYLTGILQGKYYLCVLSAFLLLHVELLVVVRTRMTRIEWICTDFILKRIEFLSSI
jgi:hypothetical protein